MVDKIIDSFKSIGSTTGSIVTGTFGFTKSAVEGAADLTFSAVSTTAGALNTGFHTGLHFLNVKEWAVNFGRQYILSYFLQEEEDQTPGQKFRNNFIFLGTQFLISPIERIRMLIQNQHIYSIPYRPPYYPYTGAFDCFFKELRYKGFRILFRGATPLTAYHLFYFNFMDYRIKTVLQTYKNEKKKHFLNICDMMKSFYLYDLFLFTLSHPIELIATKVASNPTEHKLLNHKMYTQYTFVNFFKLYQGFSAVLMKLNVNYFISTPIVYYIGANATDQLQLFFNLVLTIFMVEFVTYPFDLIKRRLIVQNCIDYSAIKYYTIKHAFVTIYKEEHISGLYKGCFMKFFNWTLRRGLFLLLLGQYESSITSEERGFIRRILSGIKNKIKNLLTFKKSESS